MARWLNVENDLKTLIYQTTGFQVSVELFYFAAAYVLVRFLKVCLTFGKTHS